ncbi:unnamed protein product [Bursaphelenchus xylophilus]|uniref:(pine wood nematode) hypothetical protein n=1 Tax=Bursaphelenchus xylophilus TaxID=6326 RepID=A0A1I7STF5_BURXY|nr:unnamed protein product [Bursaphelenchus xylophilus]CAG9108469.1 unnamed protein product [Bursaphelenchus xylophilus]
MSLQSVQSTQNRNDHQLNIDEMMSEDEARRRREQLARRPSYRMILKDLETVGDKPLKKEILEEPSTDSVNNSMLGPPTSVHFEVPTSTHLNGSSNSLRVGSGNNNAPMRNPNECVPADPGLTARLMNTPRSAADIPSQPQPQIQTSTPLLSVAGTNGLVLPVTNDILNIKAVNDSQISLNTSGFGQNEWQTGLLSQYGTNHSPLTANLATRQGSASLTSLSDNDESNRKRQVRLLKNREAAKECRRKKKEYVKCLENRVAVLENQNKALIEELKTLKDLYCRKEKEM